MAAGGHRYRGRGDERGQASLLFLGLLAALLAGTLVLFGFGQALGARSKPQRAADLAAVSAAQVMSRNYTRLFEQAVFENGLPNPHHLSNEQFLALARAAASRGARRNGVAAGRITVESPGGGFAPTRVKVETAGEARLRLSNRSRAEGIPVRASAAADITPRLDGGFGMPASGSGGGYDGPLAYRTGKPMRPDVALAFDRLAAAARREVGLLLFVSSGFRSDAEQAKLFAAHPDPKWVAPPGESLHRYATELDPGPPAAYAWLAANATRYGFRQRYSWEPWHCGMPLAAYRSLS
jgi:D-alanyl-D-alanine carboxypeptidase/Putative Flp pilus-assembly TadE/G-like